MRSIRFCAAVAVAATLCAGCGRGAEAQQQTEQLTAVTGSWTEPLPLVARDRAPGACPVEQKPALANRGDGDLIAVWYDAKGGDLAPLVWAELKPGARRWSAARPLGPDARGYWQDGPVRLAGLGDGRLVATWETARGPGDPRRPRWAVLAGGARWSALPGPPGSETAGLGPVTFGAALALASGVDGSLHAVGGDGVYSRRVPGGDWMAPVELRPKGRTVLVEMMGGPSPQRVMTRGESPRVAAAPDGSVLVTWWDDERTLGRDGASRRDLTWTRLDPRTAAWSRPQPVPGGRSEESEAAIAAGPDGFVVVWTDDQRRLQARSLPYSGRGWARAMSIADRPGARAFDPALARGTDGRLLLTWRSFLPDEPQRMMAAVGGPGGWAALPPPPAGAELFSYGALWSSAGRPVVWFDDPRVQAGCAGVATSELVG